MKTIRFEHKGHEVEVNEESPGRCTIVIDGKLIRNFWGTFRKAQGRAKELVNTGVVA